MRKPSLILFIAFITVNLSFAIVGDWVSYGSQLTLKDLKLKDNILSMSSHGGIVNFDLDTNVFSSPNDDLEHIDILKYFTNTDGSEWFSYASGIDGISYRYQNINSNYFDFNLKNAKSFTGNENNVFAAYINDLSPEVAHFVKTNNRYIFQDNYNQFPGTPSAINDISILGDSIYLATDKGLVKGWLYSANLKPESAWEAVSIDSIDEVSCLFSIADSLFFVSGDMDVYRYYHGLAFKVLECEKESVGFYYDQKLYYATKNKVYDVSTGNVIYSSSGAISGFLVNDDILWVAEENNGLRKILLTGNEATRLFIPNTMLYTTAHSLAITNDRKVLVCGLEGISILDNNRWHNLVFSRGNESVDADHSLNEFYADTLDIAYRVGGETAVYDALVSSENELFCSITHITISPYSDQSPNTEGPGALQRIDLNSLTEYTVYDTSESILDGTQGVAAGSSSYLMMHGLAEDKYGNIWAINAHTLAGNTLLKFQPNGSIQKFSTEDSDDKLQILAREMTFDNYGRLWIANEARQSDEPITAGGITVFDPNSGIWALINTSDGLISNNVYSIDMDPLTGNMWVATESGVQMIRTPSSFGTNTDFSMNLPIDGLSGMVPVKIRIDARGNKWILTQSQGIQIYMSNNKWFDDGNGLSTANSGLLDDVVYDLVFDNTAGYAYLLTASGLSRYEMAWTEEKTTMDAAIVFPQPFEPGTDPYIVFDGLADQSQVRISTLDGRVLISFESDADENKEKQLVWDGKLANGGYIQRGVYLAFITNIDGLKSTIKFAVK